jgi:hypothetical protein
VTPETRYELEYLVSALCDDQLTDADRDRLDALLASDAECRQLYLEMADLHGRLLAGADLVRSPAESRPRRSGVRRRLISHALAAALAVALTIVVQFYLWPERTDRIQNGIRSGTGASVPSAYVATLTYASACEWETGGDAPRVGTRFVPGQLRLRRGLARLRFDTGAELLIEGPASLRVASPSSAMVLAGKVVFRADETATPFDLRTPTASLVDFGTEYGVLVGEEGEEVHVFEGEVHRTPHGVTEPAQVEQLKAGEARRYDPDPAAVGQQTPLAPGRFVREPAPGGVPIGDPAAGLLAYEGFDYRDPADLAAGRANGGVGWADPWVFAFARPVGEGKQESPPLNIREGLRRPGSAVQPVGGSFDYIGFTKAFRKLKQPVRLDSDGVYYMSYLFRHNGPPADPTNAVAVLLWTDDDARTQEGDRQRRLNIGVGGNNQVFTHIGGAGSRTPLPLTYGETYLLVAKVVASRDNADQVFIRVYAPLEPVERDESDGWSVSGPLFNSNLVFDWVQLHVNSSRRQTIDEFRLGTTWASVTAPWVQEAAGKK